MGGSTISSSDTRIEALSLQSSAYGVPTQWLHGTNRLKGNLFWYGGFKATAITSTQSSGGKGGGVKTQNTTYAYTASVMMGLCEGPITGVPRAWKGKQLYTGGSLPTSISNATETYAVPASGAMVYTVAHAAAWLSVTSVTQPTSYILSTEVADITVNGDAPLANGADYTAVNGVLTILNPALRGVTLTINYQWASTAISQDSLQQLGLTFGAGAIGQAVWSPLSTIAPAQALGYSGLAYVAGQDYPLGTGAQVDNHTFEVQGPQAYSISSTVPDANPALAAYDLITNARYGANFPAEQIGNLNDWSTYCLASGLLMSPLLETQIQAGDFLTQMAQLTNTAPVWSNGRLKMIPYGDTASTANGATFTPSNTPQWDLTDDDFAPSAGAEPIRVTRKAQADAFNTVKIEFLNRGNLYNIEIAEAKDSANIDAYGLRVMPTIAAHWICDPTVARAVAQLVLQRMLYVRNTYQFNLGWPKIFLEPMDLVTITDSALGFNKLPVRITSVEESESGDLAFEAEDFPLGTASAATYQSQLGAGYQHNYNAAPGSVAAPIIFEAPGALTVNGLELYVAASGAGANWGGANLWVSLDGSNYKQVGTLSGASRYGTITADSAGTLGVTITAGTLLGGSSTDAAKLSTLCYVAGATKEYLAYTTATLTGALAYNLGGLVRGAYGTASTAHTTGDKFVRIDQGIAKSGPLDLGLVGQTVYIKLTSYNIYGGAVESLATATAYTYTITGAQVYGNAGAAALQGITSAASDNILSAGEKPPVILDYTKATAEQSGLDAQATAYGVTTEKTTYDSALSALTSYLSGLTTPTAWNNLTGDTTIVGTTFRSTWASLYAARQALLNKIDQIAGTTAAWAGVSGSGKPADNATVGAQAGTNLKDSGGTILADAAIKNSAITLNSSGNLSGAGGGAVTLGGLGTTGVVGGGNICVNGDFLLSSGGVPTNFENYNNGGISVTNSVNVGGPLAGTNFWRITNNAAVTSTWGFYFASAVSAFGGWKAKTNYVVSFYARMSANPGSAAFLLTWNSGPATQTTLQNPVLQNGVWQRYVFLVNFGSSTIDGNGFFYINPQSLPSGNNLDFACVQVEQGDIASGFAVAPLSNANPLTTANKAQLGYTGDLNATQNQSDATTNGAISTAGTTATWGGVTGSGKAADNATVGATWGSNLTGQPVDSDLLNTFAAGGVTIINHPAGGNAAFNSSGQIGAIKIRLPQSWTNTMLRFFVEVYEYSVDRSFTLEVGGYNYSPTPSWYNCYAKLVGSATAEKTVRFGHDGTYCCVWIGEPGSAWEYPQIVVTGVRAGYSNQTASLWGSGWAISLDTSAVSGHAITGTVSNPLTGASWTQIPPGTGKAADNATVGATWGSNLTGQPANSALLNSLQEWADVQNTGGTRPANNATVGAPAGTNVGSTLAQTVEANAANALTNAAAAQTTANTANTAITGSFTAGAISDISGTASSGTPKFLGSRTASASGGTTPYKYQWSIVSQNNVPITRLVSITGVATATVSVNISSFASGNEANTELQCVITDANGRTVIGTLSVGVVGV